MSKRNISEMKSMLSKMDGKKRKRLTVESLITDGEDAYDHEEYDIPEPETEDGFEGGEESFEDGIADIKSVIKNIRLQVLDGLRKIAEHPETEEYETLKRILTICDKPAEQLKKQKEDRN